MYPVTACLELSLLISLTAPFSTDISYTCPTGWEIYKNQCYLYVGESATQPQARDSCLTQGGDLLSIWTPAELLFVKNFVSVRIPSATLLGWTGLVRTSPEEAWMWTDGSMYQQFSWYRQPVDQDMCGAISSSGLLVPSTCPTLTSIFICKREAVVAYELGLPWETLSGESAYNATVTQGREAMFHLSNDVDAILSGINMSEVLTGRNEADCGLICMKTPGCSAFVFKCRQASGCDKYDCVFRYS